MSKGRNREKSIILTARVVSMLFTPFYLPLVGMMALFSFSYLGLMPWGYKLQVLTMVYLFTILLPSVLIHLYRRYRGWTLIELGHKERRAVPYVISILCYFFCISHPPFHGHHPLCGIVHPGGLCPHQCVVEDLHPHSSHRWSGRSALCLR